MIITQRIKLPAFFSQFLLASLLLCLFTLTAFQSVAADNREAEISGAKKLHSNSAIFLESNQVKPNSTLLLGTKITLEDHWHAYWQNPGDSGEAVSISWQLPEGFSVGPIQWPTPSKIPYQGLANYGYENEVVLLQSLSVPADYQGEKFQFSADVYRLVCEEICIPESQQHQLTLGEADTEVDWQAAQDALPMSFNGSASYSVSNGQVIVDVETEQAVKSDDAIELFPLEYGFIEHAAAPKIELTNQQLKITYPTGDMPISNFSAVDAVLKINDKGYQLHAEKGAEFEGLVNDSYQQPSLSFITAILFALVGGIILNLMPCVFPVLSLKALHLVNDDETNHRAHGVAYSVGVVLSFIVIGLLLIVLKQTGAIIGWGFQLQNPLVVIALIVILFLVGLNLIGYFEFSSRSAGIGNQLTQGNSLSASFFTGVLAAVVATPCTAPFMATALGYALTQPAIVSLCIFAALGFGLALPFLLLSFFPLLQRYLPKPGTWMVKFKELLSFPMFASAIWLLWVLNQQVSSSLTFIVMLVLLALVFVLWLLRLQPKGTTNFIRITTIVLTLALSVYGVSNFLTLPSEKSNAAQFDTEHSQVFSQKALTTALQSNQAVFVEMTAAWCITCKVNYASSINIESTKQLIRDRGITYLVGDWTNQDDEITRYLESFQRNGVPIYVFYPAPNAQGQRPAPIVLPQILSPSILKDAFTKQYDY